MQQQLVEKLISLNFKSIATTESEVLNFIDNVTNKDHLILMFQNDSLRDKIINIFFDKSKNPISTACFTNDVSKYKCDKSILYDELIENDNLAVMKINEFLVDVLDTIYPHDFPRIACEDTAWFSGAGFFEEHQKIGDKLNTRIINDSAILCCYNTAKLNEKKIHTVLQSRKYVILEEPFSVYARK